MIDIGVVCRPDSMIIAIRRFIAATFALWFTVLTVEPARLHACPMHAGHAAAPAADAGEHARHGGHGATNGSPASEGESVCNCLGACVTVGTPSAPTTHAIGVAEVSRDAATQPYAQWLPRTFDYALPFGNGPPSA